MAKIDIIKHIANYDIDALESNSVTAETTSVVFQRSAAVPLDTSDIFLTLDTAQRYAKEEKISNIQSGKKSYVGQHLKVVNENEKTADTYQIQNTDGDLRKLLAEPLKNIEFDFNTYTLKEVLTQVIEALGGTVKKEEQQTE